MAQVIPALIATVASIGAAKLLGGGSARQIVPLPDATRDDAAATVAANDALARRRGGAADILTGSSGATAAGSSIGKFVAGS